MTYVKSSAIHGQGLFARQFIPEGTLIGVIEGVPANDDGIYVLWIDDDRAIQVTNELKYINHSDAPNAAYYDDLTVVALRDILPDEEITHNYAGDDASFDASSFAASQAAPAPVA